MGLIITIAIGQLRYVGGQLAIVSHNLNRTTGKAVYEEFWSEVFTRTSDVAVITTNYDVLPERGLRFQPRPRKHRPGFHYGNGPEELSGSGYPSFSHIQRIKISGAVPLFKLHGSISWSLEQGNLIKYFDCRPAIRGDAAIVAPVTNKTIPSFLHSTWQQAGDALAHSEKWLIVGYSLPEYDQAVRQLFKNKSAHRPSIHIFDPNKDIAHRF